MTLGTLKTGVILLVLAIAAFKAGQYSPHHAVHPVDHAPSVDDLACRPFLPDLHASDPPTADHPLLRVAATKLNEYLEVTFKNTGLDGLSAAVVTASGIVFQGNWGLRRANGTVERENSPPIDSSSMYRVASVSKMFIAYEGWILAQRGILNWQDPVSKYLPTFLPNETSLVSVRSTHPQITLHDLASHLSGLGRDWPPGQDSSNFPKDLGGNGPPPENGLPFPTDETVLDSIRKHILVHPPGYRPSYSNTGPGILGIALVAADKIARGGKPGPETVAELMARDIFRPLGLTESTYKPDSSQFHRVVVPQVEPEMVDLDFGNAMNPSGGQFSSLNDLAVVLRSLLDPARNLETIPVGSALTPESVAHWLRPVHAYEEDDWSESGAPWEIVKHLDAWGRRRRIYFKLGNLPAHHTAFAVKPGSGYGVLILQSGTGAVTPAAMAYQAFDIFQPAFDRALAQRVEELYAGTWRSISDLKRAHGLESKQHPMHPHNGSDARIVVRRGTIYVENLKLLGREVLQHLWGAKTGNGYGVPLQSTGRPDEFRLDVAIAQPGTQTRHMACMASWAFLDDWGMKNNAGHNMLYFTGGPGTDSPRQLHYPAAKVIMQRF